MKLFQYTKSFFITQYHNEVNMFCNSYPHISADETFRELNEHGNTEYFCRSFRSLFGKTPTEYRRSVKQIDREEDASYQKGGYCVRS